MKTNFDFAELINSAFATHTSSGAIAEYEARRSGMSRAELEKKVDWQQLTFSATGKILESGAEVRIAISITPPEKTEIKIT